MLQQSRRAWRALGVTSVLLGSLALAAEEAPVASPTQDQAPVAAEEGQAINVAPQSPGPYPHEDEAAAIEWLNVRLRGNRYPEMFAAIAPYLEKESRPEIQWRMSRVLVNYYEGFRDAPDADKLKAYATSEALTRRCIATDATRYPGCYLQLGISIARVGTLKGVLKSLRLAPAVETAWLKGLDLCKGKPQYKVDDDVMESHFYYVLGIFYRIVPDWWIVKALVGTRGDKQKAVDFNRRSVALRPDPSTYLELGVALMCRGQAENDQKQYLEGIEWVQKVADLKGASAIDKVDKKNARIILQKHKLACGYSRDKFQDVENADQVK